MSESLHRVLQPAGWAKPRGYANGLAARGTMVFVAGQIGWDERCVLVGPGLVAQTERALENVVAVLAEAGARPDHVVRMTWYVTDIDAYRQSQRELGGVYQRIMGKHYPAMTLVQVKSLAEAEAVVEIEVTAVIPDRDAPIP